MSTELYAWVFFFYGLAFFSMGLAIRLETARGSDIRLRHALRPLAAFGLLHGAHEWLEMFMALGLAPGQDIASLLWQSFRLGLLTISFLSLSGFGAQLLISNRGGRRYSLLVPLGQGALWGIGALVLRQHFAGQEELWSVIDVWTRYSLGVPSALLACAGLINQQREFRRAGLEKFGQDSLWAAVAFAWYGAVGQVFIHASALPPSTVVNDQLFLRLFGFPVQILRAAMAVIAAIFVIRFLRAFEVEVDRHIAALQEARLEEAERREALRKGLLARIVQAQESERQRIARELHDETGQALTALGLGLRGVTGLLHADDEKAAGHLRHLEDLARHSLDELQRLIADLRPSQLDDLGLPAALRWYAADLAQRADIDVVAEVKGDVRPVPAEVQTALFRMAQEALTNTVKHASADHARVELAFGEDRVRLTVEDDGQGFDPAALRMSNRASWGLLGMEERAALLGGELHFFSQPKKGTRVEVSIPYVVGNGSTDEDTSAAGR